MRKKRNKIDIGYEWLPWISTAFIIGIAYIAIILIKLVNLLLSVL